jgi:hypothetical protein
MTFSRPPPQYSASDESQFRDAVQAGQDKAFRRGESIEMWPNTAIFMRDADGNRWRMGVSTTGATMWTAA